MAEPQGGRPSCEFHISIDTIGGNKYSKNTTTGSSRGVFGSIERRCSFDAGGSEQGTNMGNGRTPEHGREQILAESPYNELHLDEGTKRISATHLTPECTCSNPMNRQHSSSPSFASSRFSQQSGVSASVPPDEDFIRRNTASWFERGKMFEISRSSENTTIAGSMMIVIGRKNSSIVCLPLVRHLGISGHEKSFFKGRVSVYAKDRQAPPRPATCVCPCEPLPIALENGRELTDDMWINIGEPQTIRFQEVEVALHGNMGEDDFKKLRGAYLTAQNNITDSDEKKRSNAFVLHLEIFWAYVTRSGVWLGQKISIGLRTGS